MEQYKEDAREDELRELPPPCPASNTKMMTRPLLVRRMRGGVTFA